MSSSSVSASASVQAAVSTSVSVSAHINDAGHTVCHVDCNGQRAKLIFTGTDVILDVAAPKEGP